MSKRALFSAVLFAAFVPGAFAQTSILNVTYTAGQNLTVSDPISITAGTNVIVSSGADITYATGGTITLNPGFHAEPGSTFFAYLPLSAPGNLEATAFSSSSISFSWDASTDSVNITGYQVYRNGLLIGALGASSLSFTDSVVTSGSTYVYSVVAVDALAEVSAASTLSITATGPLPGTWETLYFGTTSINQNADYDGNGFTVAQDCLLGYNPVDFFNGRPFAILPSTSGNTFGYDPSGRLIKTSYANGVNLNLTNDPDGNLTNLANYGPIVLWRSAQSLPPDGTGSGADTTILAGDGIPNLAKYAFGLAPATAFPGDCPIVSLTSLSGGYLELTYTRPNPAPTDLVYAVQVSSDATNWSSGSGATVNVSTTVSGAVATVIVRDAVAIGTPGFGREIRVSLQKIPQP